MMNWEYASLEQFMNLPEVLVRVDGDSELLRELLALLDEELPGLLDGLHTAIHRGDLREMESAAHAFKGMLASLSINEGAALAATIEAAAREGDMLRIKETQAALDPAVAKLSTAVGLFLAGAKD